MQKLIEIVLTLIGGFLAFVGVVVLIGAPWAGVSLIAAALLIMPPVRNAVGAKTGITIPKNARALALIVLFGSFLGFVLKSGSDSAARRQAEQAVQAANAAEERRKQDAAYFAANGDAIIAQVTDAMNRKQFREALDISERYLPYGNAKLNAVHASAKSSLDSILAAEKAAKDEENRIAKTSALVEQLKSVPAEMINRNRDLYKQLSELNPQNATYREKFEHYQRKVSAAEEKAANIKQREDNERNARLLAFGQPPLKSEWDGSYSVVESYLKQVANDPASIDIQACTDVFHTKQGWLVGCDYRGKNAFGALIKQSNWFIIVRDRVVKMEEASAYEP